MCFTYCVYTCLKGVALAQHLEALRHLEWLVCLCVCSCMCWIRAQLLVTQKTPLRAPSTRASLFGFTSTHTEASPCRRGRPRRSLRSVCTHRSRLSTTVALERLTAVWAIPRKCCRVVCRPCLCCLPSKSVTPSLRERSVCLCMCACVREREREREMPTTRLSRIWSTVMCVRVWERETEKGR